LEGARWLRGCVAWGLRPCIASHLLAAASPAISSTRISCATWSSRGESCLGGGYITYIPIARGFVYLFAVLDWASRRVLAWRLSNTLTTDFCLDAVQEAITQYGTPTIFNTDQGCQFTSQE